MDIRKFLNSSYTAYHTTQNACEMLCEAGFVKLNMGDNWQLERGGRYFVTRNGSSVIAFSVGENNVFNICESHTDSPSFKIKGNKVVESEGVKRLNTEKYGGGLLYSYLDRQLKIAGRVLVETEEGVEQQLVVSDLSLRWQFITTQRQMMNCRSTHKLTHCLCLHKKKQSCTKVLRKARYWMQICTLCLQFPVLTAEQMTNF